MGKYILIVPTLNPGDMWDEWIKAVKSQTLDNNKILVLDSESDDHTMQKAIKAGFQVKLIQRDKFNHGGTRQHGVEINPEADLIIFLTQDALLANPMALEKLIKCFDDPAIGVAYGRQLPHENSGLIGAHARLFNYLSQSAVKSMADAPRLGIKTAFISNSFAAYRREALIAVGGFPKHTILSEDTYVAAKMLLQGWKIAYCAEAEVYHSHNYTFTQEFKRYFDIGVFHSCEPWIRERFGQAEGEGIRFVLSEIKFLLSRDKWYLIPSVFTRTCLKYLGYRLGMSEKMIPLRWKRVLSMHSRYWNHT
ncbi:glycosyltransferase [Propionispora hippei]|uniref:Rhamnosyltransferase n=1 Tax=Propionispora hippei DSM 15287 TaxID=1123003 RepID=A0A1M6K200_9FIRM|nr:glycosyltransferase [Propionispora hippei]SHJ52954.1 rhamnosyltransferase [Propionispora hippei DSM 15287]